VPTIQDVARHAGVAAVTVSRVINNASYVGEETRARVEAAITALGYVPNRLARGLRSKQTQTLGLVLTDITNPFWTTVARGVEDVASSHHFNVIFCNTDESEAEQAKELTGLVQKRVDGVLLVPAASSAEPVAFLREQGVPVVVVDRRVPDCTVDSVRCDSEQGAYELVRLLLNLGHTCIAALSGPEKVSTARDRAAGYRRALAEKGLDSDAEIVLNGPFTQAGGYEMARQALALIPRPTAFLAANNFIAVGAYQAVREAGLNVPEDIAIVGFDDLPTWLVMEPFLTVAAQPAYEMGRRATEMLLGRLGREAPVECREIVLPFELIVRRSSGPPLAINGAPSRARRSLEQEATALA